MMRSAIPGLGASGIIMAHLAMTACLKPDSQFGIIFIPGFTFDAWQGLAAVMTFDVLGLLLGMSRRARYILFISFFWLTATRLPP